MKSNGVVMSFWNKNATIDRYNPSNVMQENNEGIFKKQLYQRHRHVWGGFIHILFKEEVIRLSNEVHWSQQITQKVQSDHGVRVKSLSKQGVISLMLHLRSLNRAFKQPPHTSELGRGETKKQ